MKKFFIYFSIFIYLFSFVPVNTYAATKIQSAEISKIENNLFGFDYNNDDFKNRIVRLEKNIYGKESSGDLTLRLNKIASDIYADQIGKEITPRKDTFLEDNTVADNSVKYPIVDEIEMQLFKKTYHSKDSTNM